MSETVEFNGIVFRRWPNAASRADRYYYAPGKADRQRGIGRLHVEVWKAANGPVPKGWHVHHRDGNYLNNDLGNLEIVQLGRHTAKHEYNRRRRRKTLR